MNKEDKSHKSPDETQTGSTVDNQPLTQNIPKKKFRKVLGNYSYNEEHMIGWGYTSKVYKGKSNTPLPEYVAIKKIPITDLDELHCDLLRNQTKIVKKLKHPNVVNCYDVLFTKKNCYIIMEYCEEGSLEKHLSNLKSVQQKIKIISDISNGFRYLASSGIVHRDIKPGNILQNSNGDWKIADFGFAADIGKAINDNNISVGTPLYMAPQSLKSRRYTYQSDIFALGIVFYQIINNGNLLWTGKNKKVILEAIVNFNIESVNLPQPFDTKFIRKILDVKPENRPTPQKITIQNMLIKSYKLLDQKDKEVKQVLLVYENLLDSESLFRLCAILASIIENDTLGTLGNYGSDLQSAAIMHLYVLSIGLDNIKDQIVTASYYSKKYSRKVQKYQNMLKLDNKFSDPKTKTFCKEALEIVKETIQSLPDQNTNTLESFYSKNSSNISNNHTPTYNNFYKNNSAFMNVFSVTPKAHSSKIIIQQVQSLKQILMSYQLILEQIIKHDSQEPNFLKRIGSQGNINRSFNNTNGIRIF